MSSGMRTASSLLALAAGCGLLAASALASTSQEPSANVFRVAYTVDIDYVDPTLSYYAPAWALHFATGAWLLGYADAPAPRGGRLTPDVALGFPRVSKDGRTYTFHLRKNRRFSDGTPVTAASFAWAINRALNRRMSSPAQPFIDDVAGAHAVVSGNAKRAAGVRVLSPYSLRIRLVNRSGDFLARLAMPFFTAIPTKLPVNPEGIDAPYPSAGPYTFREWTKNRRVVLVRNRYYRGPRPARVDAINVDVGLPPATTKLAIDRGDIDFGDIPTSAHAELGAQHGVRRRSPGRYFANPAPTIRLLALNHDRRLFGPKPGLGNVQLKRAVNYALDRRSMLAQYGAHAGTVHDQLLPPMVGGYRDVRAYPARPNFPFARRLANGRLRGRDGVFFCFGPAPAGEVCQVAQSNLGQIGLDLDVVRVRSCQFGCDLGRPNPYDLALVTWRSNYFDPFDFLYRVDGRSIQPATNVNQSYFDSPRFNRLLAAANRLIGASRYKALGRLDHRIMREAAPVAVFATVNDRHYVSARTGCYHHHPVYGFDFPAICLRR
jgi:oligopeptide transport system substrate-binding protein